MRKMLPVKIANIRNSARIFCSAVFLLTAMATHGEATDKPDPEEWLVEAEAAYDNVTSYTAVFHKQQRVAGKLLPKETILLKYRKPASLYMRWIRSPYKGSELLHVPGWNENRVMAHRGGILRFITRNLDPGDPGLMADNLRPVTSTGIGYLLETVAINIRTAIMTDELAFSVRGEETLYGRNTRVLEVAFPNQRLLDHNGFRFVINQDVESKILIRIRVSDLDNQLIEDYSYENLNLDARLTEADFDPENPEYHF
jgi:outer membrane lipoprotein-sorting protein